MPKKGKKTFQKFKQWRQTRRTYVTAFFFLFVGLAFICLFLAYLTNPFLPHPFRQNEPLKSLSGETTFDLPNFLGTTKENPVIVFCNITSTNFVVYNPSDIYVEVRVRTSIYQITSIYAKPHNAIDYPQIIDFSKSAPRQSYIQLENKMNKSLDQIWEGSGVAQFKAVGNVAMDVVFIMYPINDLINEVNWTTYDTVHPFEVEFEPIWIDSGQIIQQTISENLNLSLTYVVLFFAATEVAIAFYDHSEDNEKKAEQEKKNAEKQQYDNANPNTDIIY